MTDHPVHETEHDEDQEPLLLGVIRPHTADFSVTDRATCKQAGPGPPTLAPKLETLAETGELDEAACTLAK